MQTTMPMAVVLAGGKGMRLRPLTDDLPKPMLPLGGSTILMKILEDLAAQGVGRTLVLTGYLGEIIEKNIPQKIGGMEVCFYRETLSRGSAGCVKCVEKRLTERFFVVCGDAWGHRDYGAFLRAHLEGGCAASILCARVKDPGEFGTVLTDGRGRVTRFIEKPAWSQTFTDLANTGIYLLEKSTLALVPSDGPFDFGADFFPALLREGVGVNTFEDGGEWRDVGSFSSYLACALAENGGKSVIPADCVIEKGAKITDSLLFPGCRVGKDATLSGAILAQDCRVGDRCVLPPGCVLGKGTSVQSGIRLESGSIVSSYTEFGSKTPSFDLQNVMHEATVTLPFPPEVGFLQALGSAIGAALPQGSRIAVLRGGRTDAAVAMGELIGGIARFADVCDVGEGFLAMAVRCGVLLHCTMTVYLTVEASGELRVSLFDENGFPPGTAVLRRVRDAMRKEKASGHFSLTDGGARGRRLYESFLLSCCRTSLYGKTVGIGWGSAAAVALGRAVLGRGGAVCPENKGDWRVKVTPDGRRGSIEDDSGRLDFWHLAALLLKREIEEGTEVPSLPFRVPRALFDLAAARGVYPRGFALTPAGEGLDELRAAGSRRVYLFDGCAALLGGLSLLAESRETCAGLLETLPPFGVYEGVWDCPEEEKLTALLSHGYRPAGEGMADEESGGQVVICAQAARGLHLMAEAADDYDAHRLFLKVRGELRDEPRTQNPISREL